MTSSITFHIQKRRAKVHKAFEVHMVNERGKIAAQQIATLFNNLLSNLYSLNLTGREMAIVETKLEEACFFAKKAMASNRIYTDSEEQG